MHLNGLLCFSLQPVSVFFTMFCFIAIPQIHDFIYHIIFLCSYTCYTYLSVFLLRTTYFPDMYIHIPICLSVTYYLFSWHVYAHIHMWKVLFSKLLSYIRCWLFFSHSEATSVMECSPVILLKTGMFPGKEMQMVIEKMELKTGVLNEGVSSECELSIVTAKKIVSCDEFVLVLWTFDLLYFSVIF